MYVFQFTMGLLGAAFVVTYLVMFGTSVFISDLKSKRIVKAISFAAGFVGGCAMLYSDIAYYGRDTTLSSIASEIAVIVGVLILSAILFGEIRQERKAKRSQQ